MEINEMMGKMITSIRSYISNKSIVQKSFISYLLVLFIPITVSGVYIYGNSIGNLNSQKDNLLMSLVSKYTETINSELSSIEALSDKVISNKPIRQFFYYTGNDIFKKVDDENNIFAPYLSFLTDTNKNIYQIRFYSYDSDIPEGTFINNANSVINQDWYSDIKQMKTNKGKWEGLHNCRSDISTLNQHVFTYYKNMYSQNSSSIIATLQLDISIDKLLADMKNIQIEKNGFIFISNTKDIIVSSAKNINNENLFEKNVMSKVLQEKGKFVYTSLGREYVIYSQPVNRMDLYLVAVVPYNEYNGNINSQRNMFIGIILISLILLILLAYFLTVVNSKKLKKVLLGIRKISKGDLTTRINVEGKDEMGEIAKDLNQMAQKLNDMVNEVYKSNIAQKDAMLSALQAQINPHFLYNTLESIKMMAEIRNELDISDALDSLGKFMRYNITSSNAEVTIKEEMENVRSYINIQKLRFKNAFDFSFIVPKELNKCKVLKMMIQPLVENAIVYGINASKGAVAINLVVSVNEDFLSVNVKNTGMLIEKKHLNKVREYVNGNKMDESFKTSGNGVGLKNINERIKLFYGEKYGLDINNFNGKKFEGVKVTLLLPVRL